MKGYECGVIRLPMLQGHIARAGLVLSARHSGKVHHVTQARLGTNSPKVGEDSRLRIIPIVPVGANLAGKANKMAT